MNQRWVLLAPTKLGMALTVGLRSDFPDGPVPATALRIATSADGK